MAQDIYVVQEKIWGPDNGRGLRHLLYHKGQRISMGEAIKAGLVKAKAEPKAKTEQASKKKGAATRRAPTTPTDS